MLRRRPWMAIFATATVLALAGFGLAQVAVQVQVGGGFQVVQPNPLNPGFPNPLRPGKNHGASAAGLSAIKLVEKSEYRQVINVARDCIKDKDWNQAVKALQTILDNKEDHYVQVRERDTTGQETLRWTSVKFEANNLLGSMPTEGLEAYEVAYGVRAKDLLDEAKKKGDRELLAEVAQRYCHTRAGAEANELLATLFLARGQFFMAALRFEKLLSMPAERTKLDDMTLFKAALAFQRAGDAARTEDTWKKLETRISDAGGLNAGGRLIPIAEVHAALHEKSRTESVNLNDWLMVQGNVTHTAQATGSPPLLDQQLWRRPLLRDLVDDVSGKETFNEPNAEERVNRAVKHANDNGQVVLPGFFPVTSQGLAVYRSYGFLNAVYIKDTKDANGEMHKAGELKWRSLEMNGGLPGLLDHTSGVVNPNKDSIEPWLQQYERPGFLSLLYENSTIGTLSCDGKNVYFIDDLAVPPPSNFMQPFMFNVPQPQNTMKPIVMHNNLKAINLLTGKLAWDTDRLPAFADSNFLGAPISIGGKLYALNEKNPGTGNPMGESELRLVCIDPNKPAGNSQAFTIVEPIQMLGLVQQQQRVTHDVARRISAVDLGYGEGILVCPTNAGEVFGVDLMTRSLVWSYPYRDRAPAPLPFQNMAMMPGQPIIIQQPRPSGTAATGFFTWKSTPPAIAEGKVVFTAPDAHSLHCINLRDGTPVWRREQAAGDLYLAGIIKGHVLVVGANRVHAYRLKDGAEEWSITTGDRPSGQGVASKNIYYLPLHKGEVLAIDVERGEIKAHNRAADSNVVPGNLVFNDGAVLSQTATEIVAYPPLSDRLELARLELQRDPDNLEKRALYGEMLLKDGQVQPAVEELLQVTGKSPPAALAKRAKDRLFEALTDLMGSDFANASRKYLDEYKSLTTATDNDRERQQRQAKFYRIVGQGREAQGNLVDAFEMYKDYGALPIHKEGGIAAGDDPNQKVPVNVWLRGRVAGMLERATPEQREPLDLKIAEEWKLVEARKDLDAMRSFVGMFDVPSRVGREARLRLAETLMDRNDVAAYLEAELNLLQLTTDEYRRDPVTGAAAYADLARLEEKKAKGDLRQAAFYYRILNQDYPAATVRTEADGKKITGAEIFNELATDKRYLPYLEETTGGWGPGAVKAREISATTVQTELVNGFVLLPAGEPNFFARQHRLVIDRSSPNNTMVRLVDAASQRDIWKQNLGQQPGSDNQIFFYMYAPNQGVTTSHNARFRFSHNKGHLLVCQVGATIYAIDGDSGKKLWEVPTVDTLRTQTHLAFQQSRTDAEGNPEFVFWNQMTGQQVQVTPGHIGAVEASYVAIISQRGLEVRDPLRGEIMWQRADLGTSARVFGDPQHLYVYEAKEAGSTGQGRAYRANDGQPLKVADFSNVYVHRIRVQGRRILAAAPEKGGLKLHLYDILTGKDVWSKNFAVGSVVTDTEDPELTGVIEPNGTLVALEVDTGRELLRASVLQGKVTPEDLKNLKEPLLLADRERFYVALNHPIEADKLQGGIVHNNFSNNMRCATVNGWVLALHAQDGEKVVEGKTRAYKKGGLAWDSFRPVQNQMVLLEQFDQLPVLIFTSRYNELINGGTAGSRWLTGTMSMAKGSGKVIYDTGVKNSSSLPMYFAFQVDRRAKSATMSAGNGAVQLYLDDGNVAPAADPAGPLTPGGAPVSTGEVPVNGPFGRPIIRRVRNLPPPGAQPVVVPAPVAPGN